MKVRVILLEKIIAVNDSSTLTKLFCKRAYGGQLSHASDSEIFDDRFSMWIAQGRFDLLWTYCLTDPDVEESLFQRIHRHNTYISRFSTPDSYYHPLYLLGKDDDEWFWKDANNGWFLAVIRIHLIDTTTMIPLNGLKRKDKKKQLDPIKEVLQRFERNSCKAIDYEVAELSDKIVVASGPNLNTILKVALSLRTHEQIGRVYTYPAINGTLISEAELSDDKQSHNSPQVKVPDFHIPYYSMRFAVHNAQRASGVLDYIASTLGNTKEKFSVVGVDDLVMRWPNLEIVNLIRLYKHWFFTGNSPSGTNVSSSEYSSLSCAFDSFSSITTRLGVSENWVSKVKSNRRGDRLKGHCAKLIIQVHNVEQLVEKYIEDQGTHQESLSQNPETTREWYYSFSRLSIALARMSKSSALDAFVYLMLPATKVFLDQFEDWLLQNQDIFPQERERMFVDSWTHLVEHIMREERQITQFPELRPPLYDIPLIVLEYILAFSHKCAEALCLGDTASSVATTRFLVVPRLCERVSAKEIFQAVRSQSGEVCIPGLVLISIPPHMMYQTNRLQMVICHEVAHFAGEFFRCRNERKRYFAEIIGILLAECIFESDSDEVKCACSQWVESRLASHSCSEFMDIMLSDAGYILSSLLDISNDNTEAAIIDFSNFVREILFDANRRYLENPLGAKPYIVPNDFAKLSAILNSEILQILEYIAYLFKEVLADICMIQLLPLDLSMYISEIVEDSQPSVKEEGPFVYEMAALRIFLSLSATNNARSFCLLHNHSSEAAEAVSSIIQYLQGNSTEPMSSVIPIRCVRVLSNYFKDCYNKLNGYFRKSSSHNTTELNHMFCSATASSDSLTKMRDYIREHRRACLDFFD